MVDCLVVVLVGFPPVFPARMTLRTSRPVPVFPPRDPSHVASDVTIHVSSLPKIVCDNGPVHVSAPFLHAW